MIHPMPTQVLLTTTFEPLVRQLSGSLARGVQLLYQFIQDTPPHPTLRIRALKESSARCFAR